MTLTGKIALVAGATRGAGRGIALELGAAGATVYCSGRSSRGQPRAARTDAGTSPFALASRPETVEETAELVTEAGGHGIAAVVDHLEQGAVSELVARIERDHGRLDVLVNDIWGGDELTEWGKPFWELDVERGFVLFDRAVRTHILTSRLAAPLMLRNRSGLLVEITDGDALNYRGTLFYDLVKTCVIRLAFAMSEDLRDHDVAAVAVTPGFLRSEAMLEHMGVREENWRDGAKSDPHFRVSETPRYVGRAVAALARDPAVMQKSGGIFSSWGLAKEYGFTDVDGTQPDWGAHAAEEEFGASQRASHERFLAPHIKTLARIARSPISTV